MVPGRGHSNQVQDIVATDDTLVSCGMDDMVMFTKLATVTQSGSVDLFFVSLGHNVRSCLRDLLYRTDGDDDDDDDDGYC